MSDDSPPDRHIGVGMGGSCPECSAPVDLSQEFCLECGAAVRNRKRGKRGATAPLGGAVPGGGRRFPWVPFLIVLGLTTLGGVWALALGGGDEPAADTATQPTPQIDPRTLTNETPSFPTVPQDPGPVVPTPTPTPSPTTPEAPLPTPQPDSDATGGDAWPAGKNGWTVVVTNMTKKGTDGAGFTRDDADARAVEYEQDGLEAGVIDSDEFSNLTGGYWVIFSGVFDTQAQANAHLQQLRRDHPDYQGTYVREIRP